MFKITLSPNATNDKYLTVSKLGDKLIINGDEFDFSSLTEGSELPPNAVESEYIVSDNVRRENGDIYLTLKMPHTYYASHLRKYPPQIDAAEDGNILLPLDQNDINFGYMTVEQWLHHVAAVKAKYGKEGVDYGDAFRSMCYVIKAMDFSGTSDAEELNTILNDIFTDFGWTYPPKKPDGILEKVRRILKNTTCSWFSAE